MKMIVTLFLLSAVAAGCADGGSVGVPADRFGDAVRFNAAAETVNPAAPAEKGPLTFDAQRAALQQGRYLTDKVEPPADTATSSISTASSGGNGGGGGAGAGATAAQ